MQQRGELPSPAPVRDAAAEGHLPIPGCTRILLSNPLLRASVSFFAKDRGDAQSLAQLGCSPLTPSPALGDRRAPQAVVPRDLSP